MTKMSSEEMKLRPEQKYIFIEKKKEGKMTKLLAIGLLKNI